MKIVYLFAWKDLCEDGVIKKIINQARIWKQLGVQVFLLCWVKNIIDEKKFIDLEIFQFSDKDRYRITNNKLYKKLYELKPDIVYFRYEIFKPIHLKICKQFVTFIEVNTDDLEETRINKFKSVSNYLRYIVNKIGRVLLLSSCRGIVSVTNELKESKNFKKFRKPIIVCPNSLNVSNFKVIEKVESQTINCVFLGTSDFVWHGLDKIEQLASLLGSDFQFHIIGSSRKNKNNVFYYGYLDRTKYNEILKKCHIAIGTLALHRKNMMEACPLKVREYLAFGLPVIIGYSDTAFIHEQPNWILKIENTEDNYQKSVNAIRKFCDNMKYYSVTHAESKKYIDSFFIEERKMSEMQRIVNE